MKRFVRGLACLFAVGAVCLGCATERVFVTSRAVGVLEPEAGRYERVFFQTLEPQEKPGLHCEDGFAVEMKGAGRDAKVEITYKPGDEACGDGRPLFLSVFEVGIVCSSDGDFETASRMDGELLFNRRCTTGHLLIDSPVVDARPLDAADKPLTIAFPGGDTVYLTVVHEEGATLGRGDAQVGSPDGRFLYHGTRTYFVYGWRFVRLSHASPRVVLIKEKMEPLVDYFRRDISKKPKGTDMTNILVSFDASLRSLEEPKPEICPRLPPHRTTAFKLAVVNLSFVGGATFHPVTYGLTGWSAAGLGLKDKSEHRIYGFEFPMYGEILLSGDKGWLTPGFNKEEIYDTFDARYRPGLKFIAGGRYTEFSGKQMARDFDEAVFLNVASTTFEGLFSATYTLFSSYRQMFHLEAGYGIASRTVTYDGVKGVKGVAPDDEPEAKVISVPGKNALISSIHGGLTYRYNPLDGPYGAGRSLFGAEADLFGLWQPGTVSDVSNFGVSDFMAGNIGGYWFPGRGNVHLHLGTVVDHQFDLAATRVGPYAGIAWRSERSASGLRLDLLPAWFVEGSHFRDENFSFSVRGRLLTPYGGIGVKYSVLGGGFDKLDFLGLEYVQNFDFDLGFARSFVDMFRMPRNPGSGD